MKSTSKTAGKIRIIGGEYRRQLIPVLNHEGLRPSSDRVRETVFNWMMHQWGGVFEDKRVLDAFAGSGAFGLECISRGARGVLMLDTHAPAVKQIQQTLNQWAISAPAQARQQDVLALLKHPASAFDWIILDPPFGHDWLAKIVPLLDAVSHNETWLYVETEVGANVSILQEHRWQLLREGKTQQAAYGLWQR